MRETQILNEKKELELKMKEKAKAGELKVVNASAGSAAQQEKKKRRWDQAQTNENIEKRDDSDQKWHEATTPKVITAKDIETPMHRVWDPTPGHAESGATTPPDYTVSDTPKVKSVNRRRWDETPKTERNTGETPHASGWAETPKVDRMDDDSVVISKQAAISKQESAKKRSRWDETPVGAQTPSGLQTPSYTPNASTMTPSHSSINGSLFDMTPSGATPSGKIISELIHFLIMNYLLLFFFKE
jgi:hypothetical protein